MTDDHLRRELAALEAAMRDRVIVRRIVLEPTYGDPKSDAPTGWRESGRITRLYRPHHTYSKEQYD